MSGPPPATHRASGEAGLTRRGFVVLLGGAAAVVAAGFGVARRVTDAPAPPGDTTPAPPPDPLPSDEARLAAIAVVGERYRAAYPDDADPAAALGLTAAEAADPSLLLAELSTRRAEIRAELAGGDDRAVAVVDGWTLARTEARLAALISQA